MPDLAAGKTLNRNVIDAVEPLPPLWNHSNLGMKKTHNREKPGTITCPISFYLYHSSISYQTFFEPFVFKFRVKIE